MRKLRTKGLLVPGSLLVSKSLQNRSLWSNLQCQENLMWHIEEEDIYNYYPEAVTEEDMRVSLTNVKGLSPSYHSSTAREWIGETKSRISRVVYRVENLKWDENDHPATRTKDALDRNVRSQGVQVGIGICKDIGNFTSALENLELETKDHPGFRTSGVPTDYFNDSEQEETVPVFKTREKSTFQLVIQGPEILIFQGTRHSPADIAPYWKKDSRMWLWKSVRLARRLKRTKAKAAASAGALYREDFS